MPIATLTPPSPTTPSPEPLPDSGTGVNVRLAPGVGQRIDASWIADRLRRAVEVIAPLERVAVARVHVLIVDDARMIDYHRRHSSDPTTTDVLAFDSRTDSTKPIDADLIICADEAARRAAELGHSIERELLLYCVHGLLHCAGHDDHDNRQWRVMHAREDEILEAIGVGATFEPPRASPDGGQGSPGGPR